MKAILLDRDETLNQDPGYINDPALVVLKPGVVEGLRALKEAGYQFFVMTNQSGVARGLITPAELDAVHHRLSELMSVFDLQIEKFYVCPHGDPIACDCRKPRPGMFMQFFREHDARAADCYAIGDKMRDIQAAEPAGVRGILVGAAPGTESEAPKNLVYRALDFKDAADYILKTERG